VCAAALLGGRGCVSIIKGVADPEERTSPPEEAQQKLSQNKTADKNARTEPHLNIDASWYNGIPQVPVLCSQAEKME
jgi:hypothetical protein